MQILNVKLHKSLKLLKQHSAKLAEENAKLVEQAKKKEELHGNVGETLPLPNAEEQELSIAVSIEPPRSDVSQNNILLDPEMQSKIS